MSTNTKTIAIATMQAIPSWVMAVILVVVWGGLIAATRTYLDFHLGIPGHTGILWIGLLISGRLIVRRNGTAMGMGAAGVLWGIPMGMGHDLVYNLALYMLVGGAVDLLARVPFLRMDHVLGAAFCGASAHLAKVAFLTAYAMSFGLYRNFLELGLAVDAAYHILFGALGGVLAVTVIGIARWTGARRK